MISAVKCVRISSFLFALLLGALIACPAVGQDITGALQGTVVSPEGKPAPDVRISVSGPYLQGARETTTDRNGFFQLLALPPGTYALHATRLGLRALDVRDIVVVLGRTAAVGPLTLETQPIELKPVEVQAHALSIDPVHTTAGGTLEARDYAALPVERDYRSLLTVLPQANDSHRGDPVNVGGSTGLENQYYIDGVNVTDARVANRATSLPYDFVRAVDVKTGGYEAQYGRALGAIVNAVTYSGTNDFESSVFGFVEPVALSKTPAATPTLAEAGAVRYDYGARLSGPIVRDRLWYSAAVNPRVDQVEKTIVGHGQFLDRTSAIRFASKLTWRANPTTSVELSLFGDPTAQDQVLPPDAGVTVIADPRVRLVRLESGGTVASLRATMTPSPSLLLQASVAQQWDRYSDQAATAAAASELMWVDYVAGTEGGGRTYAVEDHRGRTSLAMRGTLMLNRNTVAAGAEYEIERDQSSLDMDYLWHLDPATWLLGHESFNGTFHNRAPAAYLQDTWRVTDRLALNAGLRWSGQYLVGASGRTAQRITDEWQPRGGFSWQLGRANDQRLFGSYGRFYQSLPSNITVMWFVDYNALYSIYSSDPRLPGAVPDAVLNGSSLESDYAHQIPGLHAENFDEFTLGYERLLGGQSKLTLRGVRRDLRSSFQWGQDNSRSMIFVLGTPGRGDFSFLPAPKREYTALEVAAEGTVQRLRYRAAYVLSRNWGNYPGLYDSDAGLANPGRVTTFESPHQAVNSTGYLPNDHTHVAKLSAAYDTEVGIGAGALFSFESGAPINEFAAGPGAYGPGMPSFVVQRGTAGRTPALWNLDLRLTYELPGMRGSRARIQADVLHVGNPRRAIRVDELHYLDSDRTAVNPNYQHPTAYQPPMAARLGVQVGF
jgi:hypothetical protein